MKPPLPLLIHGAIRSRLLDGSLKPGNRLDYKQLAKELGVSTTPVREAVTQLATEGYVELIPRLGAVVRSLTRDQATELFEVREAIESYVAAKAAERVQPRHLEQLNQTMSQMQQIMQKAHKRKYTTLPEGDLFDYLEADLAFHRALLDASRNAALTRSIEECQLQARLLYKTKRIRDVEILHQFLEEHQRVQQAIANRDPIQAASCMSEHIRSSLNLVLTYFPAPLTVE